MRENKKNLFWIMFFLLILVPFIVLPESVQADTDTDENMTWKSVLTIDAPNCQIIDNGYGLTTKYDLIAAEVGGSVTFTIQPKEGYAVYYRRFKFGNPGNMNNSTRIDASEDDKGYGLIEGGKAKKFSFDLPDSHVDTDAQGFPFTYIVLKENNGVYYRNNGVKFDVENAEDRTSEGYWAYGVKSAKEAQDDESWFYGQVTQVIREKLTLDAVNISNIGESLEFKSTTTSYYLKVKNSKDMVLTGAVNYYMGGDVTYTIDGGEALSPDSEGRITIPGISELGGEHFIVATTQPLEENSFEQAPVKYYFTITREKSYAPLKGLSVKGAYKPITFEPETYDYSVAVDDGTSELEIQVDVSTDSTEIQYQIDNGEKLNLSEDGKIPISVTKGKMSLVKIYTTADENSDLYQDGVYTIQILWRLSADEILKKATQTESVIEEWAKEGKVLDSTDSAWLLLDLKTYGTDLESLGITKDTYLNSEGLRNNLDNWQSSAGHFQEKAVMGMLAAGCSLNDLSAFQMNDDTTVNLLKDDFLGNFSSLWALSDNNFREYLGEDEVLARALELSAKQTDKGEYLDSHTGGTDGTAMSIQAFSTWYGKNDQITASVDKALEYLSGLQNKATGLVGYSGYGYYSSETISQWIVALSSLGIDANDTSAFMSDSGLGLVDVLIDYFMLDDGNFEHTIGGGSNGMATEQAFRALASYKSYLDSGRQPTLVYNARTAEKWTGTDAVAETIIAIDTIGEVSKSSGENITAARTAYDSLTDVEKNSMPDRYEQKLISSEESYEPFKAIVETEQLIGNIGEVTLDKEQDITDARVAYEALTDEQKKQVENRSVLEQAEKSLADDKQTVENIQNRLNTLLPLENLTTDRENEAKELQTQIHALRQDMYDALENAVQIDAVVSRIQDLKDVEKVEALIEAIGTVDTLDKEQAVLEAQTAYKALEEKQVLLKQGYAETLENAVQAIQELKENAIIQNVIDNINKLLNDKGEISVTLADGEFLTDVRGLYEQAEEAGLADKVTNRDILFQAEERYLGMVVENAAEKINALPNYDDISGTSDDGSDIVMTQEQLNGILDAQMTYEALTDAQKAKLAQAVGEAAMNNYRLDVQTAETYEGYIETVLQTFIQKVMDLQLPLSDASVDSAKENLAAAQRLMEQYEGNEAAQAYLDSVEGFTEKIQAVETEINKVETDLADALAVDKMIAALPAEINSDEERAAAQNAVDAVHQIYDKLSEEAKNYVMRMADVDTAELLISNYDNNKEEAAEIERVIREAEAKAAENLTSDTTVAAVKRAQDMLDNASVTAKKLISEEIKAIPGNLQTSIQQEKNKQLQENTIAVIKETIPYDVVVEIKLLTSGNDYDVLKDGLKDDKKAEIADVVSISAYQLIWDEEKQDYVQKDWILDGGFTVTLYTDSKLDGNEVFLGQYTEDGEISYLTVTVGEDSVTFKADALTAYAIGLKEKEADLQTPEDGKTPSSANPSGNSAAGNGKAASGAAGAATSGGKTAASGGSAQIPKTGDSIAAQVNMDMAMILLAVGCLAALCAYRRKEGNR